MLQNYIGIDSGSTLSKAVLLREDKVIDSSILKTGWDPKFSAQQNYDSLLKNNAISMDEAIVSSTGYGREIIGFSDFIFTEIICHAQGGLFLVPGVQGIIDIGGQDSKIIKIENGKAAEFLMNDKCAAGTGRFLNVAAERLGIAFEEIDQRVNVHDFIPINSMCTVFAETEIVGLLSERKDRGKILAGVLQSIAQRVAQMIGRFNFSSDLPVLLTGGLSQSRALLEAISKATGLTVLTHQQAPMAGAIGACLCARQKILANNGGN